MENQTERLRLSGDAAVALWQLGHEAWNAWVKTNPQADIDFSDVDFSQYRDENNIISFGTYHFPNGDVNFSYATFGDGGVYFSRATFGEGKVLFSGASFGKGDVDFSRATFNNGEVNFNETSFGDGNVSFSKATFVEGDVNFSKATFGEGDVSFRGAIFGEGDVSFRGATFDEGDVSFSYATFVEGDVHFSEAAFGEGKVDFSHAIFGDGNVLFIGAIFGEGNVLFSGVTFGDGDVLFSGVKFGYGNAYFNDVTFGDGQVNFQYTDFKGLVIFTGLRSAEKIRSFDLQGASFEKSLAITETTFKCVPDLRNTNLEKQVSLEGLRCEYKNWYGSASNNQDSARLRRLKEIEESNKHHAQALAFHADERRAKRGHQTTFSTGLLLDLLFDWLSLYGQSIVRPLLALLVVTVLFGGGYYAKIPACNAETSRVDSALMEAMLFSATQSVPFIPNSHESRTKRVTALYTCKTDSLLRYDTYDAYGTDDIYDAYDAYDPYIWNYLQALLSLIFLFLAGLGLRNRFRI